MSYNPMLNSDELIKYKEVANLAKIGQSTVWKWTIEGKFPQPRRLSRLVKVWIWSEVLESLGLIGGEI